MSRVMCGGFIYAIWLSEASHGMWLVHNREREEIGGCGRLPAYMCVFLSNPYVA